MDAKRRWLRIGGTALAAAALLGLPGGGPVLGAAPPNDDRAAAIVVAVPGSRTGDTTAGAKSRSDEPGLTLVGMAATVWYRIHDFPTTTGILVQVTPGTLDPPALIAWRGPDLDAADRGGLGRVGRTGSQAEAGETYLCKSVTAGASRGPSRCR